MKIDIINKRSQNYITLESYVNGVGILITKFIPGEVPATFNKVKGMNQYGSSLSFVSIEEREVLIDGIILGSDRVDVEMLKRSVDDILNPLDTLIIKYTEGDIKKEIEGNIASTPSYSGSYKTNNNSSLAFSATFECFNPFWVDQDDSTLNVETWEGGFEFEFELPSDGIEFARKGANNIEIINYGNVEAPIEVYFKGPALNPSITLDGDKFIKINKEVKETETLYIKTAFGDKAVQVIKDNIKEQAYNYIDIDSKFFNLKPGKNLISYATEGDFLPQSVIIKYKSHYLSI